MTPKFAFSIAHAAHKPERAKTLEAMLSALPSGVHIESAPGKPHEWSERPWWGALECDPTTTHCVLLNDDLVLCDKFVDTLTAAVAAQPEAIINLYNEHDLAMMAMQKGFRWLTSRDGLLGTAYVLPAPLLLDFLGWRGSSLRPGAVERLSEDQLINLYAMAHGLVIWHTVPALVDHAPVETCYPGNRVHRPKVGPHPNMPMDWSTDALHAGRVFHGNHWALLTQVKPEEWKLRRLVERAYEVHGDTVGEAPKAPEGYP